MFQASDVWVDRSPAHHGRIRDDRHVRLDAQKNHWVGTGEAVDVYISKTGFPVGQVLDSKMGICQRNIQSLEILGTWNKKPLQKLRFVPKKWLGLLMATGCHLRRFLGDVDDCHRQADARMKSAYPHLAMVDGSESGFYYSYYSYYSRFVVVPWFSGRPLLFWDVWTWISIFGETPDCSLQFSPIFYEAIPRNIAGAAGRVGD